MGRSLSPAVRQELAKLDKDSESRRSAMKALKLYVKDIDSSAIPFFLAQVSEKDTGSSSGEYAISLYEALARVHGPKIVSHIDNITSTIIKTLTASGGSFPLQQACSKVVPAIARYGIEPTTPEEKKRYIIHSLCKPLCDSLLCSQENLSCGAALCLKSLVDCDNWRFASDDMVHEVCRKLCGALEDKPTQTNSHMGLVMSLAKRNSLVVEAYARLLVLAGLRILNCGLNERNSQKRLTSIQMVHSLMRCLDIRSIYSELELIIEEMETCQTDQMAYVKGAALEAMQTAKKLLLDKGSKIDSDTVSVTGSNYGRSGISRSRNFSRSPRDQSPSSGSPESQTLDSFAEYESFVDSPISLSQASCNVNHLRKNANRKLWHHENGAVDVSLKDGLFSGIVRESSKSHESSEQHDGSDGRRGYVNGFPGFGSGSPWNGRASRSHTPSPQRSRSQINVHDVRIFSTPRQLVRSLQDDDESSGYFENVVRKCTSSANYKWSPVGKYGQNGCNCQIKHKDSSGEISNGRRDVYGDSEVVSSTEDEISVNTEDEVTPKLHMGESKPQKLAKSSSLKTSFVLMLILVVLIVAFMSILGFRDQNVGQSLVPT